MVVSICSLLHTRTIFAHCFLYVRNAKLPNKYILFSSSSLALTRILFFCLFFVCSVIMNIFPVCLCDLPFNVLFCSLLSFFVSSSFFLLLFVPPSGFGVN